MHFVDITGPPGKSLLSACLDSVANPEESQFVQLLISDSEDGKVRSICLYEKTFHGFL